MDHRESEKCCSVIERLTPYCDVCHGREAQMHAPDRVHGFYCAEHCPVCAAARVEAVPVLESETDVARCLALLAAVWSTGDPAHYRAPGV
jgi:hypothetical protein